MEGRLSPARLRTAGAFYRNRWAGVGLIAGACSMIGIPLFAGFASKLNLAMASFESPAVLQGLAVLALSTLLNALYYIPVVIVILDGFCFLRRLPCDGVCNYQEKPLSASDDLR